MCCDPRGLKEALRRDVRGWLGDGCPAALSICLWSGQRSLLRVCEKMHLSGRQHRGNVWCIISGLKIKEVSVLEFCILIPPLWVYPSLFSEVTCNTGDPGSVPESGRSPGERHGNRLQYSFLEIPWTVEPVRLHHVGSQRVGTNTHTHTHTRTHMHTHAHTHTWTHTHTHTCTHMHTRAHTCTHAHTHAHIDTRTHTHTHILRILGFFPAVYILVRYPLRSV